MRDPIKVMFVCTGNSARSQMAEGFARHFSQGRVQAYSAGMEPSRLNPFAAAVMQEKRIDISQQRSKAFDEDLARRMDVVVTVCGNADERCPSCRRRSRSCIGRWRTRRLRRAPMPGSSRPSGNPAMRSRLGPWS